MHFHKLIGNPPWVAYRYMTGDFQKKFKMECEKERLWVGGEVATHQDLSAYFFAKTALLYLKPEGKIAFLLPNAALSRKAYEHFREGYLRNNGTIEAAFQIDHVWSMKREIGPLFPVPSCAVFATKTRELGLNSRPLPSSVTTLHGKLPYRDVSEAIANARIRASEENWPKAQTGAVSPYAKDFQQGATLVPRRFALVKPGVIGGGRLGSVGDMPQLVGRAGNLDKAPWRSIQPPTGKVENSFLRPVLLGSSIAAFRQINAEKGVIPVADIPNSDGKLVEPKTLDARAAMEHGFPNLANWMENAEELWNKHSPRQETLVDWWNYRGKLIKQFPIPKVRVVYAASGTHMAAAIVGGQAIIDSSLYWAKIESLEEAQYLVAILNSETAVNEVRPLQSQGLWGPRHFSKYVFETLWPRYKEDNQLHQDIVEVAKEAEQIAASVEVPNNMEGLQFINVRKEIRDALAQHGVAQKLNELTRKLLDDEE